MSEDSGYYFKVHEDYVGDCCQSFREYSAICEEPIPGVYVGIRMSIIDGAIQVTYCPWCGENVDHLSEGYEEVER